MSNFNGGFVKSLIFRIFSNLRKTQIKNLSLGVYGLIVAQSGLMSKIARRFGEDKIYKHQLKRLWRFLSNPRIKPERLFEFWIKFCICKFCPPSQKKILVALDWTDLPGNIPCLMLALPYHGRAIPLFWRIIAFSQIKDSQNRIEERMVAEFLNILRDKFPNKQIVLTADRGFGRASFMEFLLQKQAEFILRVKSDVKIKLKDKDGKTVLLRTFGKTLKPEVPVWMNNISYRDDGVISKINLAAVVAQNSNDPWFLVTNLATSKITIETYRKRFQIEEWFKDLKQQLGVSDLQTKNMMRVRRLIFVACVSYAILMLVGNLANKLSKVKEKIITKGKHVCSRIWLALEVINNHLLGYKFWQRVRTVSLGP